MVTSTDLAKRGVQLGGVDPAARTPARRRLLWRFEAIHDPSVKQFLIRDADSLLNVKEQSRRRCTGSNADRCTFMRCATGTRIPT